MIYDKKFIYILKICTVLIKCNLQQQKFKKEKMIQWLRINFKKLLIKSIKLVLLFAMKILFVCINVNVLLYVWVITLNDPPHLSIAVPFWIIQTSAYVRAIRDNATRAKYQVWK